MFYRPHKRVTLNTGTEMVTKQSHKDECDIHRILRQYQRTGIITHVQSARPTYGDLPDAMDYQTSLHVIMEANEAFAALPSSVRERFANDPGQFLAAFEDPSQAEYLREMGFLKPVPSEPPRAAPDAPPGAS